MKEKYADVAQFFVVYIKEAHPVEYWPSFQNDRIPMVDTTRVSYVKEPQSPYERLQVASVCVRDLKISIPCLIDDMENTTERAYSAHPERLYIVGKDGKIAYKGGGGPAYFKPEHMEQALRFELIRIGSIAPSGE